MHCINPSPSILIGIIEEGGGGSNIIAMKKIVFLSTCLLSTILLMAQIDFVSLTIVGGELAALGARSVFAADLDGDGDMDIISASMEDNKVAWYEQDEQGNFTVHSVSTEVEEAQCVHAADLDGDGDADIIASGKNGLWCFENEGNGIFTPMNIFLFAFYSGIITTADMDGDCDLDVVVAFSEGDANNSIEWYENSDEWAWPVHVVDSIYYPDWISVDAGDMDGDGDIDIIALESSGWWGSGEMSLFENTGDDIFSKHVISNGGIAVFLEDIDGDDDLDIVSEDLNHPAWHENIGNNEFITHQISSELFGYGVIAVDMDDDGDIDILADTGPVNDYPHDLCWFENDGSNNFPSCNIIENDIALSSVFASDIDMDGDMDIVVAENDNVSLFNNNGEQDFEELELTKTAFQATNAVYSDMDGDGDMDVVSRYANTIAWYENDGNQQFTTHIVEESVYINNHTLYAEDIDGDNDVDIIYGFDDAIFCSKNNGAGSFLNYKICQYFNSVESFFIDDLDQDEDLDILVSYQDSFKWYENNGTGYFSEHNISNFDPDIKIRGICSADLENDGDMDILVAKSGDLYAIYCNYNDGTQNFSEFPVFPGVYGDAGAITAKDFDLDGDMDFIYSSNTTQILCSQISNYNFLAQTLSVTGDFSSFFAQDLDMDGDDDILITDFGTGYPSFTPSRLFYMENLGGNMFNEFTITEDLKGAMSVYAGDINGDDDIDLLTASYDDSRIAWHENLIIGLQTPEFRVPGSGFRVEVFPNPTYAIVYIEYEIENPSPVHINVFNAAGEKVAGLQDGYPAKGKHMISWDAGSLPSGLYFCHVIYWNEIVAKKIIKF